MEAARRTGYSRCALIVLIAACDKGSTPAPSATSTPSSKDPCAAQLREAEAAGAAVKKALADQHLEIVKVEEPPMPFTLGISGVPPRREDEERQQREWAPFDGKRTGDVVRWTAEGKPYEGIVVRVGDNPRFVKRGTDLFLATPRAVRTVACNDPTRPPSNCGGGWPVRAFGVPPGMKFGGIIKLDVEDVDVQFTGADCQLPP